MVKIPDSVETATHELGSIGSLIIAGEWRRAAIVYAFVDPRKNGENQWTHFGQGKSILSTKPTVVMSQNQFVGLGIIGLRSSKSVRRYYRQWQWAIDSGKAQPVKPGDEYIEPDLDWDDPSGKFPRSLEQEQESDSELEQPIVTISAESEQELEPEPELASEIKGPSKEVPRHVEPDDEPDKANDEPTDEEVNDELPAPKRPRSNPRRKAKYTGPDCTHCRKELDEDEYADAVAARSETFGRTLCAACRLEMELEPNPKPKPQYKPEKLETGAEPGDSAEWEHFDDTLFEAAETFRVASRELIGLKFSDERYSRILELLEDVHESISDFHKWGQDGKGGLRIVS